MDFILLLYHYMVDIMIQDYLDHIFDEVDTSIHLDEEQKAVVLEEGNILVIAGAGSGKTTTMVAKVKYLVEIKKVKPEEILLISYTNKATEELIDRIQKQFSLPISILTFHKLGLQILQEVENSIIKTDTGTILSNMIEQMKQEKDWKWKIHFFARKYRTGNDLSQLVFLSEAFIKNYKMKGRPSFRKLKLSKFWRSFLYNLLQSYDSYMESKNYIDFEDMIEKATKVVKNTVMTFPYQYIIVDEYQDISKDRFLLLKAIEKRFHSNFIVVGDDWQSIFGFSGAEITLFTDFKSLFPLAKQMKITKTYRNSQELIDIAGKFIMKNSHQIQKQLSSPKHIKSPIMIAYYWTDRAKKLQKILKYISSLRSFSCVFLLGRYHQDFQIKEFPFLEIHDDQIYYSLCPNLNIQFLTVHSAKGLGADEVILLNGGSGLYGFPTNKKTDPILKSVESIDNSYSYAEERRLFYVALTRTKNHVFILCPQKNCSSFIKEIKKENPSKISYF